MNSHTSTSIAFLTIAFTSILLCPSPSNATTSEPAIRVHGSDLFSSWLPEYFHTHASDLTVEFNLAGSHNGMVALEKQFADASIYIQTKPNTAFSEEFESIQIGHYVLYLHADQEFPAPSIAKETIARIGQTINPMRIEHWYQIFNDCSNGWEAKQAEILIDHTQNDFTLNFFRLVFLDGQNPSVRVHLCLDQQSLQENIARNNGCIIISPNEQLEITHVHPLQLSDFNDPTSFSPSTENIQYADYSAAFPIFLILPRAASYRESLLEVFQNKHFIRAMKKNHLLPSIQGD